MVPIVLVRTSQGHDGWGYLDGRYRIYPRNILGRTVHQYHAAFRLTTVTKLLIY
jgi:hypothetical protein